MEHEEAELDFVVDTRGDSLLTRSDRAQLPSQEEERLARLLFGTTTALVSRGGLGAGNLFVDRLRCRLKATARLRKAPKMVTMVT